MIWFFHMGLTICFGTILGGMLGLTIGAFLFKLILSPRQYRAVLDISADSNPAVVAPPQGTPVSMEMRNLLQYTENWTHWPDSERVSMINRILAILWPRVTKAGLKIGLDIAKDTLAPMLIDLPYVEDITLGRRNMADKDLYQPAAQWVRDKEFNTGTIPFRIGGIKSYDTPDDEVVMEMPILWGSDLKIDIGLYLKFGLLRLYVPIEISNLQMKLDTRVTVKPLVETIPCVGGVTISLLKVPLVDMNLKLFSLDLLSLPFARKGLNMALQRALGNMLIYPSSMSFPIMEHYGVPPAPKGALSVHLIRGEDLPGEETFVRLKTRGKQYQYGKTVRNEGKNPKYHETFTLIIEDFEKQQLGLTVFQNKDDNDFKEPKLAVGKLPFGRHEPAGFDPETNLPKTRFVCADFIQVPMQKMLLAVPLVKPVHPHKLEILEKKKHKNESLMKSFSSRRAVRADAGKLYLNVTFMPFYQPVFDDEEDETHRDLAMLPTRRLVTHNVPNNLKGVLTVHIIRCINLKGDRPTTYVKLLLKPDDLKMNGQTQTTQMVTGENNPRFGQKFDFVMIPANCSLIFFVFQKEGKQQGGLLRKRKDLSLGSLSLPVKDVARNGLLKDTWTLSDTERGQIELHLKWQTCYINDE